ncbi:hypothetical protein N9A45_01800 [bacterium]|nr:hypothetical protein [bacterium]
MSAAALTLFLRRTDQESPTLQCSKTTVTPEPSPLTRSPLKTNKPGKKQLHLKEMFLNDDLKGTKVHPSSIYM